MAPHLHECRSLEVQGDYSPPRFLAARGSSSYRTYYMEARRGARSFLAAGEPGGPQARLAELQAQVQEVAGRREEQEARRVGATEELGKLRCQARVLEQKLRREEWELGSCSEGVATLQEGLNAKQKELALSNARVQEVVMERGEAAQAIKGKERALREGRKELLVLRSDTNPLRGRARELEVAVRNQAKLLGKQEKVVRSLEDAMRRVEVERRRLEEEASQFEAVGRKATGQEVATNKTVKQLNARILQLQRKIDVKPDLSGYSEMKERYAGLVRQVASLEGMLEKLEDMTRRRLVNFKAIRGIITDRVRRRFNQLIAPFADQLGSRVFLRVDHKAKELTFLFEGRAAARADLARLSGGEKSCTQMCLIFALWEMMEPPFRCLDEWDVFLDGVNRKAVARELLRFGLRDRDRQFVFISPQVGPRMVGHPGAGDVRGGGEGGGGGGEDDQDRAPPVTPGPGSRGPGVTGQLDTSIASPHCTSS